jgi:hypothetical protein
MFAGGGRGEAERRAGKRGQGWGEEGGLVKRTCRTGRIDIKLD